MLTSSCGTAEMSKTAPLNALLKNRSSLFQVLVATVLLAVGVNLLSTWIAELLQNNFPLWLPSIVLFLVSAFLIVRQSIPSRFVHREINGFVLFKRGDGELIKVPRYKYSSELKLYITGLFAENSAPKLLWDSDPVHNSMEFDIEGNGRFRTTEAGRLIVEATEYYILETLSVHLTDFFNNSGFSNEKLQEFSRENIPDIIFRNRFLDTFSRPMRERAAFTNEASKSKQHETVVASYSSNGSFYSKFDLTLPSGAKIQRLSPSSIFLETSKFKLTISIDFKGISASLPKDFCELYLDGLSFIEAMPYLVRINVSVEFKPLALFSPSGWEYHAWLDSFLEKLSGHVDSEEFFKKIQWESALTVAQLIRQGGTLKINSSEE